MSTYASAVNVPIPDQNGVVIAEYLSGAGEETLVAAARAGDRNAFAELCELHSRKVLLRIYRILRNREDAEDAFQESILRAFVHIETFEGRSRFTSWLTRIAINSALEILQRKHGKTGISIERICDDAEQHRSWEPRDPAETPEARYARRESEALLQNAIQRLPNIAREMVMLRYARDYSCGEVAEVLGISLSAAKTRLMRARRALRRRLSGTRPRLASKPTSTREASMSGFKSKTVSTSSRNSKGASTRKDWRRKTTPKEKMLLMAEIDLSRAPQIRV